MSANTISIGTSGDYDGSGMVGRTISGGGIGVGECVYVGIGSASTSGNAAYLSDVYGGEPVPTNIDLSDDALTRLASRLKGMFEPPDVLVKCPHCGQWAAAMTACHYCGAPVDPVERHRAEPVTAARIANAR